MDYETQATNRQELRACAKLFRSICGFSQDEPIDPIVLLDRLPDMDAFEDVHYEIVYDDALPGNVPAQCEKTDDGWLIQIKESVYMGAYEKRPEATGCISCTKLCILLRTNWDLNRFSPENLRKASHFTNGWNGS